MILTAQQMTVLGPLLATAAAAILVLLLAAFTRARRVLLGTTVIALAAALAAVPLAWSSAPLAVTPLLYVDHAALLYIALLATATLGVVGLAAGYERDP